MASDGASAFEEPVHQLVDIFLQERFTPRDLDERAAVLLDRIHDVGHRPLLAFVERIRRVAPRTAQIARGQAHEHTALSRVAGLPLDRVEDLVDGDQTPLLSNEGK